MMITEQELQELFRKKIAEVRVTRILTERVRLFYPTLIHHTVVEFHDDMPSIESIEALSRRIVEEVASAIQSLQTTGGADATEKERAGEEGGRARPEN